MELNGVIFGRRTGWLLMIVQLAIMVSEPMIRVNGQELSGVYTPTPTAPLSPDDAVKSFSLPKGYEISLFAAEPDVINPVAMTWDEKGRLWVLELFEYPSGAKEGEKPRDKVKVLEDTDGDGKADKVTVFADGLNLATGLALGNGGVYVGQAPHLLFFKDFDGDDVADTKEIVLTGFGLEDRHELLNGFQWGPDGWLYMTHGVFTHSNVKDPNNKDDDGVIMNAALARFHPHSKKFEIFADGTSNPWGVDFDMYGNAFVSACVIDHLFYLAPGGLYVRQAGSPEFPYAYELLPSIVDHTHFRAAYAGVQVYQGNTYPNDMQGKILMGNIHHNSVHLDVLTPSGSSFLAGKENEFVKSSDGWFRPVATKTGPDGNIWIMDWYDRYPCYQNAMANPAGVDRQYGRIYRVLYNPDKKPVTDPIMPAGVYFNIDPALVANNLKHPNNWVRRKTRQWITEKKDNSTQAPLEAMVFSDLPVATRLEALWSLHGAGQLAEQILDKVASDSNHSALKVWAARLTGERGQTTSNAAARLKILAESSNPSVQSAVATALRQFTSGSLTVNTPPRQPIDHKFIGPAFQTLLVSAKDTSDRHIKFLTWMATEPILIEDTGDTLDWFLAQGESAWPLSGELLRKAMRRICDTRETGSLDLAVQFIHQFPDLESPLLGKALEGLIEGQRSRTLIPSGDTQSITAVINRLLKSNHDEVKNRANELGTLWGNATALKGLISKIKDGNSTEDDRIKAIEVARSLKDASAREALLSLVNKDSSDKILMQVIQALGEIGGNDLAGHLIARWKDLSPGPRNAAAQMMTTRWQWAYQLIDAINKKQIAASEIPTPVIRNLVNHQNDWMRDQARKAIGTFNDANVDRMKIFQEKRKMVLNGKVDLGNGRKVAESACLVCHKLLGNGLEVGPDLTGVGRSSLDALLANIIMPDQIIGNGYELVIVDTKDFRTISGRLVEDSPNRVALMSAGGTTTVIERDNIESLEVTEKSVMPEGLEQIPDNDFRDLIWYILAPPEEGPLTDEKKSSLIGGENPEKEDQPKGDKESVSLWNPDWHVVAQGPEFTPRVIPEFRGARNVLELQPVNHDIPASLMRKVSLPENQKSILHLEVGAHAKGDWELQVSVNDQTLIQKIISSEKDWHSIKVDLSEFAGQNVSISCFNKANNWHYEHSYWKSAIIASPPVQKASAH